MLSFSTDSAEGKYSWVDGYYPPSFCEDSLMITSSFRLKSSITQILLPLLLLGRMWSATPRSEYNVAYSPLSSTNLSRTGLALTLLGCIAVNRISMECRWWRYVNIRTRILSTRFGDFNKITVHSHPSSLQLHTLYQSTHGNQ